MMLMKKILLIGGTTSNRALLKAALEEAGHRVSAAITRKYTNRWLSHRIKPFDMIVYDTEEAAQDATFWKELREAGRPSTIVILTSAFDATDYAALGMDRVMRRPYTIGDVVRTVNELAT